MRFIKRLLFCRRGHTALAFGLADPRYSNAADFCVRCGSYLYKW